MNENSKDIINFTLYTLKNILKEENVIIGALVNKKNPEKTKLVFLDKEKYQNGERDGFVVDFDSLNN